MVTAEEQHGTSFRATWRSPVGPTGAFLLATTTWCLFAAVTAPRSPLGWLAGAALQAAVVWLIGRQLWSRLPLLRVSATGMTSFWLKGHTIPWPEIRAVRQETVQGNHNILIELAPHAPSLAPTRRWLQTRKPERRIPLGALAQRDRDAALAAALGAFSHQGGAQAAVTAEAQGLEAARVQAFDQQLRDLTPFPWALYAVVLLNVAVWLLNLLAGLHPMSPLSADLFRWGANSTSAMVRDGDYWRLISAAFLHGGLAHLAFNMLGLWSAGLLLNRLHGNGQFLAIYFGSAVIGNALSLHFSAQQSVSVGASGAVFGVLGALLVGVAQHRERIPALTRRDILTSQGIFVAYSLSQGSLREGVDNAAHVGGLAAGAAMAWLLVERIDDLTPHPMRKRRLVLAMCLAGFAAAALVWSANAGTDHRGNFEVQAVLTRLKPRMQAAEDALRLDASAHEAGRLSDSQLAAALEGKHIPAYDELRAALAPLRLPPGDPREPWLRDLQELFRLLPEMLRAESRQAQGDTDAAAQVRSLKPQLESVGRRLGASAVWNKAPDAPLRP